MRRSLLLFLCLAIGVAVALAVVTCTASGAVPTHPTTTLYTPAKPTPTTVYVEDPARHDNTMIDKTAPDVELAPATHAEIPTTTGTLPHTC